MAAAHHTTVHEDTAEKHEQHSDDGHQTRRSVGAGTTTTNGGPRRVKNLDNFDEKQSSGVLINSPRSLQACRKEGIDPAAELYYRDLKSFVLQCKGDVDVAKVKHRHYMERRAEALEMVRARRRELIEEAAQDEMGSTKQPSPAEFQAQNSTNGEDGRPLAGGSDQGDENASLTSSQSPRQREKSQPKGGSTSPLSPEEFQRQQAEAKRLKVARQVDKMKRVAEQNKQREEAQLEHMAAMRRQMKQQEIERQEQLEREEVMRYLRERAARKRDAELAIQKEQREAATEARMEDLRLQREAKEQQLRLKEQERLRREEQRRIEREEEMERQREEQRRRLQGIYEQNEELIALKAEDLAARIAFAEEQRQKLQAQRDEELRQRKEYNARKQAESEEKRRRANAQHESRIGGYVHRAEHVKKAMEEREQHRQNLLELKRLEEEENERRRQEIRRQVLAEEKAHQLELQKRLEEEDRRRQEENARRQQEAKLRLAQKEIEVEDRVALVKRMQLRLENDCFEAGMRYEAKMSRIEELRHEMKKADEDRKKLQYEMVKHKLPPGAFQHPTPGPGEYAVVDAERKLAAGPSVRMGGAPVKSRRPKLVGDAPGPGAYSVPISAIRAHKGAKLPPRHATAVDMQQKRAASALAILPPVKGAKHSRSPTQVGRSASAAPSSAVSPTKSADRPAELRDEDFATDDEYDDA